MASIRSPRIMIACRAPHLTILALVSSFRGTGTGGTRPHFLPFLGKCGGGIAGNERQTHALSAKFHRLHVPAFDALVFLMLD
jgi:hypothetical protein